MCESDTYQEGIGVWCTPNGLCVYESGVYVSGAHPNILRDDLGCMKVMHA